MSCSVELSMKKFSTWDQVYCKRFNSYGDGHVMWNYKQLCNTYAGFTSLMSS